MAPAHGALPIRRVQLFITGETSSSFGCEETIRTRTTNSVQEEMIQKVRISRGSDPDPLLFGSGEISSHFLHSYSDPN